MGRLFTLVLLLALATAVHARPGEIDATFADFGVFIPAQTASGGFGVGHAIHRQGDGKILFGGEASNEGVIEPVILRVDAAGNLDPTYGSGGIVRLRAATNGRVARMLAGPGGTVLVGGSYNDPVGRGKPFVARLGPDGEPDTSFGAGGLSLVSTLPDGAVGAYVRGMAAAADGGILVTGMATVPGGDAEIYVMRLTPSGSIDTTFGTGGMTRSGLAGPDSAEDVAVMPDGSILAVGSWNQANVDYPAAMRLLANGAREPVFGGGGLRAPMVNFPGYLLRVRAQADGGAIVAGSISSTASLVRLAASGDVDTSFNGTGYRMFPGTSAVDVEVLPDLRYLALARNANHEVDVQRVLPDGTLDATWNSAPLALDAQPREPFRPASLAAGNPDGATVAYQNGFRLAAFAAGGAPAAGFGSGGFAAFTPGQAYPLGEASDLAVHADGSMTIPLHGLTRLDAEGSVLWSRPQQRPGDTFAGVAPHTGGAALYATRNLLGATAGGTSVSVYRILANGDHDTGFANPSQPQPFEFVPDPYGRNTFGIKARILESYADGRFLNGSASGNGSFQRFLPDGTLDNTFNFGTAVQGQLAAVLPDDGVLAAHASDGVLRKYQANGGIDLAFGTGGVLTFLREGGATFIERVAATADGKLLVAGMSGPTASRSFFVARLLPTGAPDTSFGTGGFAPIAGLDPATTRITGLVALADGRLLAGGTEGNPAVSTRGFVARWLADGTPDAGFGTGGLASVDMGYGDETVAAIALQPGGRILAAGARDGIPMVTRLLSETASFELAHTFLPVGGRDVPYRVSLAARGGSAPFTYSILGGELPPGITLTGDTLEGTPTLAGFFEVAIRVTDSSGATADRLFVLSVYDTALLVTAYYDSILGRSPDFDGRAFWLRETERMAGLGVPADEVFFVLSTLFFTGAEYANRNTADTTFVNDLYRTFLRREADAAGRDFWMAQLAGGKPRSALLADFLFSIEFWAFMREVFGPVSASPHRALLLDFYRGLLQRLPDDAGFLYWESRFRAAACAGNVVAEADSISALFLGSGEYQAIDAARPAGERTTQYVIDLYKAFLRRATDSAGLAFWVGEIDAGRATRESVRRAFAASPEFQARVAAVQAAGCPQ
jgi:uncharacterized delta-60 repeat protein